MIGPGAYPAVPVGGGSARVEPFAAVSLLQGISDRLGTAAAVTYHRGLPTLEALAGETRFTTAPAGGEPGVKVEVFPNLDLSGTPVATRTDRNLNLWEGAGGGAGAGRRASSARWTGYFDAQSAGTYDVFVQAGGGRGGHRLLVDDALVVDSWLAAPAFVSQRTLELTPGPHRIVLEQSRQWGLGGARIRVGISRRGTLVDPAAKALAAKADVVIAAVGFDAESESESADRTFRLPNGQDDLVRELLAANKNTIVVLTAGGNVDMNAWLADVPALVHAWYAGQEGGTAVADVLFGDVNPSGRLPVTFERRFEDNPVHDSYYPADPASKRVEYKEGVFVGYRGYERNGTKPLFPFGYGLSYTSFEYDRLTITPGRSRDGNVSVSFDVTNTGSRDGADVAQVYLSEAKPRLPRPPKELKGFAKVEPPTRRDAARDRHARPSLVQLLRREDGRLARGRGALRGPRRPLERRDRAARLGRAGREAHGAEIAAYPRDANGDDRTPSWHDHTRRPTSALPIMPAEPKRPKRSLRIFR